MSPVLNEQEFFNEPPEKTAERMIREAAPFAAAAVTQMAQDETVSPSVRLRAAQYIIDRNLGPVGAGDGKDSELETFLKELNREANSSH